VILNGLVMFNIDPVWTNVVVGIVLIIAIFFDTRINREKTEY
jgi:ABC-type xylose transport system permease subunit